MEKRTTVAQLLADGRERVFEPVEDEAAYHRIWTDGAAGIADPLMMAVAGGLCADRLAWVFVAGYQAAVRHTFALNLDGWVAFAVSEDRRPEDPLPGVVTAQAPAGQVLRGYKTWIAAVDHVDHLIVKANRGQAAAYFLLRRSEPGLSLSVKPPGSFLRELSQGVAALQDVRVTNRLDASAVGEFAVLEPLYIYAAFSAWVSARSTDPEQREFACQLVERIAEGVTYTERTSGLASLDLDVQNLLDTCESAVMPKVGDWAQDRRLIAMYSAGLQARRK